MDEVDLDRLRRSFANGRPVLVLGPGMRRVGYDDEGAPGWADARRRLAHLYWRLGQRGSGTTPAEAAGARQFLDLFWWARQSDETQRKGRIVASSLGRSAEALTGAAFEDAMWPLRLVVFDAFRTATVGLGATVAGGQRPVTSWASLRTEDDAHARAQLRAVGRARLVVGAANSILKRQEGDAEDLYVARVLQEDGGEAFPDQLISSAHIMPAWDDVVDAWGTIRESKDPALESAQRLLNLTAVEARLVGLETALMGTPGEPARALSGATVEWLGDLLWHVTTGDLPIPPSQADLAFYVNLSTKVHPDDPLTRARPGDHRSEPHTMAQGHEAITRLVDRYDPPPVGVGPDGRTDPARIRFARTMAASLAYCGPNDTTNWWRVAIVTDYDRALERSLAEVLEVGDSFHVVLPVLLPRSGRLDWLFGTFHVSRSYDKGKYAEEEGWRWFDDDVGTDLVKGPVVVRLSGSPTQTFGPDETRLGGGSARRLGIAGGKGLYDDRDKVEPATLFSERDVLVALTSFLNLARSPSELGTELVEGARGLEWHGRQWFFLGHGFHDWLPRLHLFLSTRASRSAERPYADQALAVPSWGKVGASTVTNSQFHHLAIDREFSWPERALLAATAVDIRNADLLDLLEYYKDAAVGREEHDIGQYLRTVADAIGGSP